MIEQALYQHLIAQSSLSPYLTQYNNVLAVFNQEAPADNDSGWKAGSRYGRVVFAVDMQGDPERTMGGTLAVDIMCKDGEQVPEVIEPIIRGLIHGYFFSSGTFVVAAQWKNSAYFTQPTDRVNGITVTFDLLGFPVITTTAPDVIARLNAWTGAMQNIHVINYDTLPASAWKPTGNDCAIYWRVVQEAPAGRIPDTYQTIWRTATVKGHIFAVNNATAAAIGRGILTRLYAIKRLLAQSEAPIMVNSRNTADYSADPLRTGQLSVDATYGIIVAQCVSQKLNHINIQ